MAECRVVWATRNDSKHTGLRYLRHDPLEGRDGVSMVPRAVPIAAWATSCRRAVHSRIAGWRSLVGGW
jgi:hypothetical protein